MFLEIHDLNLFFDEKQILAIDEIQIEKGELVTLLGPSGCGSLRCCAVSRDWNNQRAVRLCWTMRYCR